MKCSSLEEGIKINNQVDQGLSSSLFTQNLGQIFKVCNSVYENNQTFNQITDHPSNFYSSVQLFTMFSTLAHFLFLFSGWVLKDLIAVLSTLTSQRVVPKLVELLVVRNILAEAVNQEVTHGSNT